MGLERCRPLELHGKVHQAPVALFVELARVREPYVRNTSRAARRRHTHAVNYQVRFSKDHMPHRNHLAALRALQVSAVRPCRFRWARRKQWTSRTGCGLACALLAFRKYGHSAAAAPTPWVSRPHSGLLRPECQAGFRSHLRSCYKHGFELRRRHDPGVDNLLPLRVECLHL